MRLEPVAHGDRIDVAHSKIEDAVPSVERTFVRLSGLPTLIVRNAGGAD